MLVIASMNLWWSERKCLNNYSYCWKKCTGLQITHAPAQCQMRQEPVQLPAKACPWGSISLGFFSSLGLWESILTRILHGVGKTFRRHGIPMPTIWHFQRRPKISQKHQKFDESDSSVDVPEIFIFISSNICGVKAAGFSMFQKNYFILKF